MSAAPEQPSQSPKHRDSAWGGSAGSNLYLATFLATLFLLLFGSCCIVVRSYMMRRRIRRHIHELFMPEASLNAPANCRCRKRRPKFYDRWIAPAAGNNWSDVTPLSLRTVFGKRSSKPEEPSSAPKNEQPKKSRSSFISWKPSTCSSSTSQQSQPESTGTSTKFEIAQIAVLIEMPSQSRSKLYGPPRSRLKSLDGDNNNDDDHDDEDDDDDNNDNNPLLPELVIGYARCHKHWWMDMMMDIADAKVRRNNDNQPSPQ